MRRVEILDAIRGACVIIMVTYHFMYNLVTFLQIPYTILYNPFMNFMQVLGAGGFITICGISSRFSRSNIKRGVMLCGVSALISLVTYIFDKNLFVVFGIIHLLAFCTLTYGIIEQKIQKIRLNFLFPTSLLVAFIVFRNTISTQRFSFAGLSIFGFTNENFRSSDYFPVLPWIFLFYIGVFLGRKIKEKAFPQWFYTVKNDTLAYLGKKSLIIYVVHQPLLVGVVFGLKYLLSN